MELLRKDKLLKLKKKNLGNKLFIKAIDKLIDDIENAEWRTKFDVISDRPDADRIHGDDFFFFDIHIHRSMIMIVFQDNEAEVLWVGSHDEYDKTFKGNKYTIETWIRNQGKIK